jgi:hypothetical protein
MDSRHDIRRADSIMGHQVNYTVSSTTFTPRSIHMFEDAYTLFTLVNQKWDAEWVSL